ncbi:hypothetical protein MYU51_012967 [Penicillium brevicompactum]|uniref:uncharacterized protein n=1 Tax=Penicillium brevicompactum TaxID=5074 RepID=UPI002540982D|nr:uncharacterized protein N7506_007783 [Penicillium brevicompactum]KAJ5334000.1 hypothetical protein N7506_007783 [Penicillium brevicompactum]
MADPSTQAGNTVLEHINDPRITIKYCTQCRWMLRAAYFAQELLSTFSTDLGEVALVPMTGGVFTVTIRHHAVVDGQASTQESILWDRKRDGGFPEVKALKSLVRNVIAPERDLGHTDRALRAQHGGGLMKAQQGEQKEKMKEEETKEEETKGAPCEDCQ